MTLCVPLCAPVQDRTQSVQNGIPTRSMGTIGVLPINARSSRSSVGMHFMTLCVTTLRASSRSDAERPELRYHAERGSDNRLATYPGNSRSSRSSVGMHFMTLCVTTLRASSRSDAERPELRYHAQRGSDNRLATYPGNSRSSRSSVGMHFMTLCVTTLRASSRSDAERPELRYHAERGSDNRLTLVPHAPAWECIS
ncbi:hypothetical protein K0038_04929 [Pseudomonas syringae]|nr:hypothetical protein [Pseudomonas syringae]